MQCSLIVMVISLLQGMMPNNMPMSPDSMPPQQGNKPGSPYYNTPFNSKRSLEESRSKSPIYHPVYLMVAHKNLKQVRGRIRQQRLLKQVKMTKLVTFLCNIEGVIMGDEGSVT